MPNHCHLILYLRDENHNLNKIIGNGKRFLAYEIIRRLKLHGKNKMLNTLTTHVSRQERNKGQKHKVFEKSFDAKPVYSDKFLNQKLDYIHYNPVKGKWNLVEHYLEYEHSSASYYETGSYFHFQPRHYNEIW